MAVNDIQDTFGRKVKYLRLSVTDRCDFRCTYCMSEKMEFLPRSEILSLEECLQVAKTFVGLGVDKIRLTGGEPLTRKDLPWLASRIRELAGLRELTITTNGSQLAKFAQPLVQAGIDRVNISLDSLEPDTFHRITRTGNLPQVLAGIDAAIEAWGPRHVKLNTVLIRDINHLQANDLVRFALARGIDISFIEQMPLGETGYHHADSYYSNTEMLEQVKQHFEVFPSVESTGGPARYWRVSGHESRIGFISPHSHNFCADCNRMRVTARGELFPCLGNEGMVDLLPAVRAGDEGRVRDLIAQAAGLKPKAHTFDLTQPASSIVRFMSRTGG
ncbi:GTP 3',8-cyclase MoaA [Sideroxydans sp. CL21]|uniref:GTP 3',8-cyclase MoaA n=1 Tax=Sideroxydans sp. CL21 TaxID=2600596 RepID=UPI0024BD5A01|nr:GTP 3',8-cyclase MoaA [Sideroxydans sp. CL21]